MLRQQQQSQRTRQRKTYFSFSLSRYAAVCFCCCCCCCCCGLPWSSNALYSSLESVVLSVYTLLLAPPPPAAAAAATDCCPCCCAIPPATAGLGAVFVQKTVCTRAIVVLIVVCLRVASARTKTLRLELPTTRLPKCRCDITP